ncbi:MAG: efflux transporter outer membrane subunit [Deltaproteobacteria bacterium]|nr:efflux transporter outer membrane subunit [Deltaproteobacteria bacterium]
MGPDFKKPDMDKQIPASYQHVPSDIESKQVIDRWWSVFNDSSLDQIVEAVLIHNLDIKKAVAAISELRSYFVQSRADRYPDVSMQGEAKRQRIVPGIESDVYNLSLPASFEIDLWGRLARAEEAARASLMGAEENARTIAQSIVAEAITLYLQIESLERRIQITKGSIENYRRNLSLVQRRYEGGLTSILDLRQSRRILAQAEASLPSLRQELGVNQQKLAVLLGRYPKTQPSRHQPEDYFRRLDPVPQGLPSDLLLRRPDIRLAEATLRNLNAKIGVAKASRFPRISLTGTFGYSSTELDEIFHARNEFWNIAVGAVQPLFDAGKLKAGQRAAEAKYEQGLADYIKTVLTAFSEVENALLTRKEQLERRELILNFLTEARATEQVAQSRYERGLDNYLTVLDAQRTRFQAEENLVFVDLAILSNRVTLHRALGGGWADPISQAQ